MRKKAGAVLLAISMIASLVACGSPEPSKDVVQSGDVVQNEDVGNEAKEEQSEPVQLTMMVFDRGDMSVEYGTPIDNKWENLIQDAALEAVNVNLERIAVPRTGSDDKIQTLMAAGDEPDIFLTYEQPKFVEWATEGYLADLTEYMKTEAGQKIINQVGQDTVDYWTIDGKIYAVSGTRAAAAMYCSFIRKDMLDKVGVELDTKDGHYVMTPSQLFDALTKIKEAGLCDYPYGIYNDYTYWCPVEGAFYSDEPIDTLENLNGILNGDSFIADGRKEAIRFWNKCYNAGLIHPDFALYNTDQLAEMVSTGTAAFWSRDYSGYLAKNKPFDSLYQVAPDAEIVAVEIIQENGGSSHYEKYSIIPSYCLISSDCEDVEAALEVIAYMLTDEKMHVLTHHGVEGEHYNLDDNGNYVIIDAEYNSKDRVSVGDLNMLMHNDPCSYGLVGEEYAKVKYGSFYELLDKRIIDAFVDSYDISISEGKYAPVPINTSLDAQVKWASSLEENMDNLYIGSVMAASDKFDEVYDNYYQIYMEEGGKQLIEEKIDFLSK